MFTDARNVPAGASLEADLCIVGGGAAGITLAREFAGRSTRVVLLESGGESFEAETQSLYAGPIVGLPYFPLDACRLRFFGGTTNHWGGDCRPFDDADFEQRDWVPGSGWPISNSDLDGFNTRAQDIVQVTSAEWDTDEWVSQDRFTPLPFVGDRVVTRIDQITPLDKRSFAGLFGDELRGASNITVYLEANVTRILTDEGGTVATGVQVEPLSGNRFQVSARQIVVAVGGIENVRLLLVSTDRHPNGLGNENDLVGRFFLEHPRFVAGIVTPADPNISVDFYQEHAVGATTIQPRLALSRDTQRDEGLVDVQLRVDPMLDEVLERAANSDTVDSLKALRDALRGRGSDDLGRHLADVTSDLMTWQQFTIPGAPIPVPYPEVVRELVGSTERERSALIPGLLGDIAAFLYTETQGSLPVVGLMLTARLEQAPNPGSRVTLVEERDELGMPRAALDWRLSELDRHSVRRTMEIVAAEIGRAGLGRLKILFDEDGTEWPSDLTGGYHLMGTTRMSDDPKQGVVDRNCRIHGMTNLYVAGSSVFPTSGSGNPTMMIVALALRLAEHLRGVLT